MFEFALLITVGLPADLPPKRFVRHDVWLNRLPAVGSGLEVDVGGRKVMTTLQGTDWDAVRGCTAALLTPVESSGELLKSFESDSRWATVQ